MYSIVCSSNNEAKMIVIFENVIKIDLFFVP
jgi:hypothetical protein